MNDNTKQAGDVKRYYPHVSHRGKFLDMKEDSRGAWVIFDSIAHLLKPQEPGEDWKDRHETVAMTAKFWQMNCESKFQRIEKLEGENRRLADEVTAIRNQLWEVADEMPMTTRQRDSIEVVKDRLFKVQEQLREALNSGGVDD